MNKLTTRINSKTAFPGMNETEREALIAVSQDLIGSASILAPKYKDRAYLFAKVRINWECRWRRLGEKCPAPVASKDHEPGFFSLTRDMNKTGVMPCLEDMSRVNRFFPLSP